MSKRRFSHPERYAIWVTHEERCGLCQCVPASAHFRKGIRLVCAIKVEQGTILCPNSAQSVDKRHDRRTQNDPHEARTG